MLDPLDLKDPEWPELRGGYRVPIDVRPLLLNLENSDAADAAWVALWHELHHQGDIGLASFAAVPHIVRIHAARGRPDWNPYALAATIELCRGVRKNPELPDSWSVAYEDAWARLERLALLELPHTKDSFAACALLSVLALRRGLREHARLLHDFDEAEIRDAIDRLYDA
jgi:hypothetical protein